jgi:hypothetical protein
MHEREIPGREDPPIRGLVPRLLPLILTPSRPRTWPPVLSGPCQGKAGMRAGGSDLGRAEDDRGATRDADLGGRNVARQLALAYLPGDGCLVRDEALARDKTATLFSLLHRFWTLGAAAPPGFNGRRLPGGADALAGRQPRPVQEISTGVGSCPRAPSTAAYSWRRTRSILAGARASSASQRREEKGRGAARRGVDAFPTKILNAL